MSRLQTLRMIACMLLMGVVAIAAYLFYQHSLYFCLLFSLMIMASIIIYICQWQYKTTRMISRMIEGIRYADFSLSFSTQHKTRTEQRLAQEINNVVAEFRTRLSENEERYQYYETLLNTVDSSLLVVDSQCNIHWMNRAAMQDLCGYRIHSVRELALLNSDFPTIILSLQPGEIKTVRIHKGDIIQELAVTVVNLKNIRAVLEENEMEAWQKLIRVLTHEIMNSIAPIISLSETLSERAVQNGMNERDYNIMLQGMQTIHRRSKGLLNFVENYRKLSRLSVPILAPVNIGDLLSDMKKLFPNKNIQYIYKVENPETILMLDRSQIEQVLINLLKNAGEACVEINLLKNAGEACVEQIYPEVIISTHCDLEKHLFFLSVCDNGSGILPEVLDIIFVPFFTTKPTGSGIGLSLCKQIMNLHGGSISASSEIGKGSCFTLKFLCCG